MYKLVTMKVLRFVIVAFVFGSCFLTVSCLKEPDTDAIMVFTPNGDGRNDVLEVTSKNGNKVSLKIFTRAGVLVFSIEAERCRWDGYSLSGKPLANGIYFYTAETTEIYDSSPKVSKNGFIYLFR